MTPNTAVEWDRLPAPPAGALRGFATPAPLNLDVEAVERPLFLRRRIIANGVEVSAPFCNSHLDFVFPGATTAGRGKPWGDLALQLLPIPMVGQLLDVVHQAVELPLPIYLLASAQREPVQPLVVADVREDRLDHRESATIELPPTLQIDRPPHDLHVGRPGR